MGKSLQTKSTDAEVISSHAEKKVVPLLLFKMSPVTFKRNQSSQYACEHGSVM